MAARDGRRECGRGEAGGREARSTTPTRTRGATARRAARTGVKDEAVHDELDDGRWHVGEALELHVFGPPSVVGLAWIGWRQGVRGHSLPKLTPRRAKLLGMVIAALLIYWLARLWGWLTLGWPQPA